MDLQDDCVVEPDIDRLANVPVVALRFSAAARERVGLEVGFKDRDLRAVYLNGEWEDFCNCRIRRQHERLCGKKLVGYPAE